MVHGWCSTCTDGVLTSGFEVTINLVEEIVQISYWQDGRHSHEVCNFIPCVEVRNVIQGYVLSNVAGTLFSRFELRSCFRLLCCFGPLCCFRLLCCFRPLSYFWPLDGCRF